MDFTIDLYDAQTNNKDFHFLMKIKFTKSLVLQKKFNIKINLKVW